MNTELFRKVVENLPEILRKNKMVNYPIGLNPGEAEALKLILYSELHTYRDRQMHASSHGDSFQDSCCNHVANIITKLEFAIFADAD